jgi:2-polyprenyl-3-methyl-5-hydroxy-6-metoxy-1,4-benzoquinol methylase
MDLRERALTQKLARHPWEVVRNRIIVSFLKKYFKSKDSRGGCLLDLGCGDLFISSSLAELYPGKQVLAVDTNFGADSEKQFFEGKKIPSNLKLASSLDLSELKKDQKIEVVLLLDVLEHVEDDRALLTNLYQSEHVDSNTLFIVTVPAFQSLFCSHDRMLGHYRRYQLRELTTVSQAEPRQVLESGYFFGGLLLARFFGVLGERLTPHSKRAPKGLGGWKTLGPFDQVIQWFLWSDFKIYQAFNLAGVHLPGLSCYQVFRAPKV